MFASRTKWKWSTTITAFGRTRRIAAANGADGSPSTPEFVDTWCHFSEALVFDLVLCSANALNLTVRARRLGQ